VEFLSRVGGNVPSHEEVLGLVRKLAQRTVPVAAEEEQVVHV